MRACGQQTVALHMSNKRSRIIHTPSVTIYTRASGTVVKHFMAFLCKRTPLVGHAACRGRRDTLDSHMLSSRLGVGDGAHLLDYDSDEVDKQYEVMTLHIIHRRRCTGFEESKDFPVRHNDVIAGRYRVRLRRSHDEQHIALTHCAQVEHAHA